MKPIELRRLDSAEPGFWALLDRLLRTDADIDETVERNVREIVSEVRRRGDAALMEFTERFDQRPLASAEELVVPPQQVRAAYENIDTIEREALMQSVRRVRAYHERQVQSSWSYRDEDGSVLGQEIRPLDRVGVYAPGGKAAYPSSVVMGAIPARVAGVGEIVLVVPAPRGELNPLVLAAAHLTEVDRVVSVGGAQAVAALAFGTESVPAVDKIVGPGNVYVTAAKRIVFGTVGIDMIAGPSEILVVCDGTTPPDWVAMDLFSQAEHDEEARAVLICPDDAYLGRVEEAINRLLPDMERAHIIRASLERCGAFIRVRDLEDAIEVANFVAPEHLELSVENPRRWLPSIRHAGAVFLGRYSSEVLGDYCAGPNHVLPTARTARFSSPLGVYDFQKRSSVIECSAEGAHRLGKIASVLARGERLTAHARSAEMRSEVSGSDPASERGPSAPRPRE